MVYRLLRFLNVEYFTGYLFVTGNSATLHRRLCHSLQGWNICRLFLLNAFLHVQVCDATVAQCLSGSRVHNIINIKTAYILSKKVNRAVA